MNVGSTHTASAIGDRTAVRTILRQWLADDIVESQPRRYRHRVLKERFSNRSHATAALIPLIADAHDDARQHLRSLAGMSLDPFSNPAHDPAAYYPQRLHIDDLKGCFGEIVAGMIAQYFDPLGETAWEVPAYLFRFHLTEFQYLESQRQLTARTESIIIPRRMPGRTGDDCLAFKRERDGSISKILYCEAKCTGDHNSDMIRDAHEKVSMPGPVDILRLIEVLNSRSDDPVAQSWIDALRQLWHQLGERESDVERYDLVSYVCGRAPAHTQRRGWMPSDQPHPSYQGHRWLEAVEVHLGDVHAILRAVYQLADASHA